MNSLTLRSPAKLNLYLNVLGKRPDGYHEIETVFEAIDLCDEVSLTKTKAGIRLLCNHPGLATDSRNLAYKAAELLMQEAGRHWGVEIRLLKRVPIAGGLGGGSSNAASVLLGINQLCSLGLAKERLMDMAKGLGADVPFFVSQWPRAIGRGRGDDLMPLPEFKKREYVLVCPNLRISSKDAYEEWDAEVSASRCITTQGGCIRDGIRGLTKQDNRAKIWSNSLEKHSLDLTEKNPYNSLESVVLKRFPVVSQIKQALAALGIHYASVSGSGPAVFGIVSGRKEAREAKKRLCLHKKPWQVFVTRTYAGPSNKETTYACAEEARHKVCIH